MKDMTPTVPINGKIVHDAAPRPMNRDERREMRKRAAARVRDAKAFILVTFDMQGLPVYSYDVRCCDNRQDVRHIMIQGVAKYAEDQTTALRVIAEKMMGQMEQKAAVEAAKEKRSEELGKED